MTRTWFYTAAHSLWRLRTSLQSFVTLFVRETNDDSQLIPVVFVQIDPAELHFLILHYLAAGPCRGALHTLELEALTNSLLPCRHDIFGVSLLTLHDHMSGIRAYRYPTTRPVLQVTNISLAIQTCSRSMPTLLQTPCQSYCNMRSRLRDSGLASVWKAIAVCLSQVQFMCC